MKNEIVNEIKQHRTVKQILESMKEKGVTLKSVSKIRTHFLKKNEDYAMEHQRLCRYAKNLLRSGYNIEQVYEIMEYDISLSRLKEISQEILKEREDTK